MTTADLAELEKIFLDNGFGTEADIEQVKTEHGGLGLFLRGLTGLDRETAAAAFDEFQAGKNLTTNQLHFLNLLIDVIAENGIVEVGVLWNPPSVPSPRYGTTRHNLSAMRALIRSRPSSEKGGAELVWGEFSRSASASLQRP
ncbi:hypothetical protein C5E45_03330 [Nocardia nova]|uniref:EcoEI R protein C-terminal domain-containing protein n=1 Tax=Nocardia nova TaxID=37330 RepID=A0A2S6AXZ5_9NOCA|nr:hypothetical protein C5E45_03330 [Nocardia nova]